MVTVYQVQWDTVALAQLQEAYDYIREDSPQNAKKVRKGIFKLTASLREMPLRFPADGLRLDGNIAFRAVMLHRYRISYFVDEAEKKVVVVRVRHTSREPLGY